MTKPTAKTKKPAPKKAHPKAELQRIKHLEACKKYREKRKRLALGKAELERAKERAGEGLVKFIEKTARKAEMRTGVLIEGDGWKVETTRNEEGNPCGFSLSVDPVKSSACAEAFVKALEVLTGKRVSL